MKLKMNACDEVNHGGERFVVSNIDQTVIVPDHVGHLLLSVAAGATRIELPEDPEPDGFARVRHVADPDAKQNPPGFTNTWTSSFSGAVPAMAYGEL